MSYNITLMQVAAPWNTVGLIIASSITLLALVIVGGVLNVLVYRPARKPPLLPKLPKLLEQEEAQPKDAGSVKALEHTP